jgi:hypothetical protein
MPKRVVNFFELKLWLFITSWGKKLFCIVAEFFSFLLNSCSRLLAKVGRWHQTAGGENPAVSWIFSAT